LNSPEMKTAGIILLLATTCLAAPNRPGYASDRALIITGGYNDDYLRSVEVYHPGTNTSCSLPSLPEKISGHSQDGFIQCGGSNSYKSCHTLNTETGQWTKTHSLREERKYHISWKREDADGSILLIGGEDSGTTTELVRRRSEVSTRGFTQKYWTEEACSITDTSSVVITGGWQRGQVSRVTRYDRNGWMEDLPSLLTARYHHGCALYTTDTGDKVYVVMGGFDFDNFLSSTETLQLEDFAWRDSTPLPRPLAGLRAATLDNIIYITGGEEEDDARMKYREEIYQLDTKKMNWVEVARMKTQRENHGLSVIKYSEVEGLCTEE